MVDRNLIADLNVEDKEAEQMVTDALGQKVADGDMEGLLEDQIHEFKPGSILKGKIIGYAGDDFLVEVGLKSEGVLDRAEFDNADDVEVGDTVIRFVRGGPQGRPELFGELFI